MDESISLFIIYFSIAAVIIVVMTYDRKLSPQRFPCVCHLYDRYLHNRKRPCDLYLHNRNHPYDRNHYRHNSCHLDRNRCNHISAFFINCIVITRFIILVCFVIIVTIIFIIVTFIMIIISSPRRHVSLRLRKYEELVYVRLRHYELKLTWRSYKN